MLKIFPPTILLGFGCMMIAHGLVFAFLPLYALTLNHSPLFIGALASAYALGVVLGSMQVERFLVKVSANKLITTYLVSCAIFTACIPVFSHSTALILLRLCVGFATGSYFIIIELYALNVADSKRRYALALYFFTLYAGMTVGASLLKMYSNSTFIEVDTAHLYFLTCVILQLLAVLFSNISMKVPTSSAEEYSEKFIVTLKKVFTPGFTALCGGAIVASSTAHAPGFACAMGYSITHTSFLIALSIVGGGIFCWPSVWLGNHQGDMRTACVLMTVGVICDAAVNFLHLPGVGSTLPIAALAIGTGSPLYMLALSRASIDAESEGQYLRFASVLGVCFATGAVIGPMYVGYFVMAFEKGLFIGNGCIKLMLITFLLVTGNLNQKNINRVRATRVVDAGMSVIFAGLIRKSIGKKRRKRIDKTSKTR